MKSSEVVREAMKKDGLSQADLAKKAKYKTQSGISNALGRENGMRMDTFIKMMNSMGYDVVVRRGKDEMVVTE